MCGDDTQRGIKFSHKEVPRKLKSRLRASKSDLLGHTKQRGETIKEAAATLEPGSSLGHAPQKSHNYSLKGQEIISD